MGTRLIALVSGLVFAVGVAYAQAPSGATGECKDGTYSKADSKRGACRGHGGVKEWYSDSNAAPRKADKAETTEAKSSNRGKTSSTASTNVDPSPSVAVKPAAGGGKGQVWVNTSSHVYHCEGDRYYGKTKQGEYMTESDAKAKGARAARGKACS